jgi:hypothetical protein
MHLLDKLELAFVVRLAMNLSRASTVRQEENMPPTIKPGTIVRERLTLRWPKSNGKPLSETLNQGFTILHCTEIINANQSDGATETTNSRAALPEPFKFDEPDDADHYCVGFFGQVPSPFRQHIQPTFASRLAWPHVVDGYRSIEPPDWYGFSLITDWAVVPDFTISVQLW